jgi:hypothetical protein
MRLIATVIRRSMSGILCVIDSTVFVKGKTLLIRYDADSAA